MVAVMCRNDDMNAGPSRYPRQPFESRPALECIVNDAFNREASTDCILTRWNQARIQGSKYPDQF